MANFRGSRGRRRVAATSRKFIWARDSQTLIVAAQSTALQNLLADFQTEYGAQLLGATVMRIRGRILVNPEAAATNVVPVIGIRVDQDVAQSPTLGVLDEPHADWMAVEPVPLLSADPTLQNRIIDLDVKSSRKIEELGETLRIFY